MRHPIGWLIVLLAIASVAMPCEAQTDTFKVTDGFFRMDGQFSDAQFEFKGQGNMLRGQGEAVSELKFSPFHEGSKVRVFTRTMCGGSTGEGTFNGVTHSRLWFTGCLDFQDGEFFLPSVGADVTITVPFTLKDQSIRAHLNDPFSTSGLPDFGVRLTGQGLLTVKYSLCCPGSNAGDRFIYEHRTTTYNFLPVPDINDARSFVGQHYRDFLNREADDRGLDFWTNQITACGNDERCVEVQRINVSSAYLLSIEFQETGYLVERFYKASFNRRPGYGEFLPNAQVLGQNVVAGTPGADEQLEANKRLFADGWVASQKFKSLYDSMTNEQYVDALIANTEAAFSPAERDTLVVGLDGMSETRATVLRKIVENENFFRKEYNRAFVLLQYFGYLRREPDEAGFNFWLGKLDEFKGDVVRAEMVKAFIQSQEYRERFAEQ